MNQVDGNLAKSRRQIAFIRGIAEYLDVLQVERLDGMYKTGGRPFLVFSHFLRRAMETSISLFELSVLD